MRIFVLYLLSAICCSAEVIREISPSECLATNVPGKSVEQSILKLQNPGKTPLTIPIVTLMNPGITSSQYSISGEVRCEIMEGTSFLEMWNVFGDFAYFSRTLGAMGPMAALTGSSDWRTFILPFDATGNTHPDKLVLNMQFAGSGTVYLRSLKIAQETHGWWSEKTAGLIGGIVGGVAGCLGAVIGVLAAKGRAIRFVIGTMRFFTVAGIIATLGGIAALVLRQPYAVWYCLLLPGIILSTVVPFQLYKLRGKFRELEMRRMESMDAM